MNVYVTKSILYVTLNTAQISDGCQVNSVVDGSITSMNKSITVTFTSDSTNPNIFFDCRIHKRDFANCK